MWGKELEDEAGIIERKSGHVQQRIGMDVEVIVLYTHGISLAEIYGICRILGGFEPAVQAICFGIHGGPELANWLALIRKEKSMASKDELVQFLDKKVFDAILNASPGKYSGSKSGDLKYVQDRTRSEKQRYQGYGTANKVDFMKASAPSAA